MKFLTSLFIIVISFSSVTNGFALPINNQDVFNSAMLPAKNVQSGTSFFALPNESGVQKLVNSTGQIPTVLVHGFLGFARSKGLIDYWGGLYDAPSRVEGAFQSKLIKNTKSPILVAEVGPFNSNYDRAVELIAQIKGSCVIYGSKHSSHFDHLSYFPQESENEHYLSEKIPISKNKDGSLIYKNVRCYKGLYPEWDDKHPINLIGHSQGGQTIRYVAALIGGDPYVEKYKPLQPTKTADIVFSLNEEKLNFKKDSIVAKYLFCSKQDRDNSKINDCSGNFSSQAIHSITSIASPHMGTTLTTPIIQTNLADPIIKFVYFLSNLSSAFKNAKILDFWLDHWNLGIPSDDSAKLQAAVTARINLNTIGSAFYTTNDFSAYDLSPKGAWAITQTMNESSIKKQIPNSSLKQDSEIKYYSIATRSGYNPLKNPEIMLPLPLFSKLFAPIGIIIAGSAPKDNFVKISQEVGIWQDNDGVVNTISQIDPNFIKLNSDSYKTIDVPSDTLNYNSIVKSKMCDPKVIYNFTDPSKPNFSGPNIPILTNYSTTALKDPLPRKWNLVCILDSYDHMDSVGWLSSDKNANSHDSMANFISNHINYLNMH